MNLLPLILILPLIGFALIALINRKMSAKLAAFIGCASVGISFILSIVFFVLLKNSGIESLEITFFEWLRIDTIHIDMGLMADHLTSLFLLVITGVGFLIHLFSYGYMLHDDGIRRFFAYLNLFVFFMLLLVLGNNLLVTFAGWEGVGLCSYLLIGFWHKDNANNDASKKAFIMNRIGDLGFLIAMFTLLVYAGSLNYTQLSSLSFDTIPTHIITIITGCLFIGAMSKSAQIPLYTWLPDAMAGPTPVSALIHAATMVTAGIYLVARMHFVFSISPTVSVAMAFIGLATSILGAIIGVLQNDIKKVLAYSTVSQLRLMFIALGCGAYTAAVFHVITHAFFKALLFLGSGSVIHAMGGEQDIRKMGGLKNKIPVTYYTFLIGTIAISGIPPFAGFFSKDQILAEAFSQNVFLFAGALFASLLTVFYMFRLLFVTFFGQFRGTESQLHHLHESPASMTIPLVILAVLSIVAGFIGFPHGLGHEMHISNWIDNFLQPVFGVHATNILLSNELTLMALTLLLIAVVLFVAYRKYVVQKQLPSANTDELKGFDKLVFNKFYVDEIYERFILVPTNKLANIFNRFIEIKWIDGLVNGLGKFSINTGQSVRLIQSGSLAYYILLMIFSLIIIFIIFIFKFL